MDLPPRERVGPREQLTLTATVREVDGWRVAAVIAGKRLAEWAVEALNEAAREAIGARVDATEPASPAPAPASTLRTLLPGPWAMVGGAEESLPMEGCRGKPQASQRASQIDSAR
jgi:hypothetical protein